MNGVLTQKELRILLKDKAEKAEEPIKNTIPAMVGAPLLEPPSEEGNREEFYLFHPDNPSNSSGYINRAYSVMVNNKPVHLSITNGVIKTDKTSIKDELIKSGFVFMYARPKGVDNG